MSRQEGCYCEQTVSSAGGDGKGVREVRLPHLAINFNMSQQETDSPAIEVRCPVTGVSKDEAGRGCWDRHIGGVMGHAQWAGGARAAKGAARYGGPRTGCGGRIACDRPLAPEVKEVPGRVPDSAKGCRMDVPTAVQEKLNL